MFKIKSGSMLAMSMKVTTLMMMSMMMMMMVLMMIMMLMMSTIMVMVLMMITIAGDLRRARRTLVATTGQAKAAATKSCLLTVNDDHDGFRNLLASMSYQHFQKFPYC